MPDVSPEFFEKVSIALAAGVGVIIVALITGLGTFGVAIVGMVERNGQAKAKQKRKQTVRQAEINYTKALMAQHLEEYARSCAETVWHNNDDETQGDGALNPPDFPNWPDQIDWTLIGASEMIKGRDIELRVKIRQQTIDGNLHYSASSEHDAREIFADGAARIGLEAFRVADDIRREIGVKPFEYPPHGINHREALKSRVDELDNRANLYRWRRIKRWMKRLPKDGLRSISIIWPGFTR
ncbi:hypothetical protein [Brevundimonas sp. CEF1]|uniref:hypothetical protein n=1 Tax=Brevundimonas sp. CEF1 TaxID=3442642 RepID=UPI003F511103